MCDGKAYQCSKAAVYFTCEPESVTNHRKNDCNNAERRTKGSFPEGLQSQQRTALVDRLENGTGPIAPRPYKQKVIDRALPKIKAIYQKPYQGK